MARALGLAIAFVLLAAHGAAAFSGPSGELVAGGEETVLRLHDLPPGYQVGDDSGCGPFGPPEGDSTPLTRRYESWVFKYWPEGCFYEYEQIFEVPELGPAPPQVSGGIVNTPSEVAAARGLALFTARGDRSERGRRRRTVTVTIPPSGISALSIRSRRKLVEGEKGQSVTSLLWRYDRQISMIEVAGLAPSDNDSVALHFAQLQQERLEHPSPYTEAERDDTEVELDDPGLKFPIYWVGRRFNPGQGLPTAELEEAFSGWVGPPGDKAALWYEGFSLDAWTRGSWKRFQPTTLGRLNLKRPCVRKTAVELEGGRAVVYAGYGRRHLRSCPKQAPDDYWAIGHIGRMVIGVNLLFCTRCLPQHGFGAYNSLAGMKAILGALTLRPKPVF